MRSICRFAAALLLALPLFAGSALADKVNQTLFGNAIEGYDPVAYFTEGRPVEGSSEYVHEWNGATWRFANPQNLELFKANPEAYAPQYGGYCAYAVAKGSTASIDPEAWSIVEGKLYLNYSKSVQQTWEQDVPGYIGRADENWPGIEADLGE